MLFNVVEDISCEEEVAADHPDIVKKLMALADKAREDIGDGEKRGVNLRPVGRFENPVPRVMANQ